MDTPAETEKSETTIENNDAEVKEEPKHAATEEITAAEKMPEPAVAEDVVTPEAPIVEEKLVETAAEQVKDLEIEPQPIMETTPSQNTNAEAQKPVAEPPAPKLTPAVVQAPATKITETAAETTADVPKAEPPMSMIPVVKETSNGNETQDVAEYIERIDSLEAKLLYLSKTAAESARQNVSSSASGSVERRLAEKDEKIALLLEEGQKLSSGEAKYRTIIKKLRQQVGEYDKQTDELRKSRDKALAEAQSLRNQANGHAAQEKAQEEARKATVGLQKEISSLKSDRASRDESIRKLQQDLKSKTEAANKMDTVTKQLAVERSKLSEEEEKSSRLSSEKDALAEQLRQEGIASKEKLERAAERSKQVEAELRTDLLAMDAKLEAMRTQAEEVSSGSGGEAQVKLLRQIETLQSQYTTASNNWQGIEATLIAKNSTLETERDVAQKRESEMRKKAREASTKARTLEEELEDIRPVVAKSEQDLARLNEEVITLRSAAKTAQESLEEARAEIAKLEKEKEKEKEKQKEAASRKQSRDRSTEYADSADQRRWIEDVAGATAKMQGRPESPLLSVQRTFSSDFNGLSVGRQRPGPASGSLGDVSELPRSRRPSAQPPLRTGSIFSQSTAPAPFSPFEAPSEPILSPPLPEEDDVPPPSSPMQAAQDMISMSTVAAGPSVQLVERMSAAIRRLEGEKVTAKEEMARVCSQRDEARSDLVGMMKDLEAAKAASARVPDLESQIVGLDQRYQTTLELLGEKSELVEELKADVQDVKAMYRELVERTVT